MKNFENNESMDLTKEFELEKQIQRNLINATSEEEVQEEIQKLVSLERNSTSGRAVNKIQDCMGVLNWGCTDSKVSNEIAYSIAQNLYPELYRNIALEKETVSLKDLKEMAFSLQILGIDIIKGQVTQNIAPTDIEHSNKDMIKSAFIKLIRLLPVNNS